MLGTLTVLVAHLNQASSLTVDQSGAPETVGSNFIPLLVALFGGAIAALVTGYFTRPKTQADVRHSDAQTGVSLSADAREWAKIWMKRSEDAETRAESAEDRAQAAENEAHEAHREAQEATARTEAQDGRIEDLETTVTAYMVWSEKLVAEIERLGGHVEAPPLQVLRWHEKKAPPTSA